MVSPPPFLSLLGIVTDDYKALLPNHLTVSSILYLSRCLSDSIDMRCGMGDREDIPHKLTFKTSVWAEKKLYGSQVEASYAACGVPRICKSFLTSCNWYKTARRKGRRRRRYLQVSGEGWLVAILPSVPP